MKTAILTTNWEEVDWKISSFNWHDDWLRHNWLEKLNVSSLYAQLWETEAASYSQLKHTAYKPVFPIFLTKQQQQKLV